MSSIQEIIYYQIVDDNRINNLIYNKDIINTNSIQIEFSQIPLPFNNLNNIKKRLKITKIVSDGLWSLVTILE